MEQLENSNRTERQRRRALSENSETSTTHGFSHSHSLGLAGSEISSPKNRESCPNEPTPNSYRNGYHDNSSNKQLTAQTTRVTTTNRKAVVHSAWQLRELLRPLPQRRVTPPARRFVELPHYPNIVKFVWHHRYATSWQVQQRFPAIYGSDRTCRYQLQRLVAFGYLGTVPVSATSPNFPTVFYTTRKGLAYLRSSFPTENEIQYAVATERFRAYSRDFIQHELLTTEFDLAFKQSIEASANHELVFHERRFFRRDRQLRFIDRGVNRSLTPDSGHLVRITDHGSVDAATSSFLMHFIEIDNGSMSVARLKNKIQNYRLWSDVAARDYLGDLYQRHDRKYSRPSFRLLIVAHTNTDNDEHRLNQIHNAAAILPRRLAKNVWLTSADLLVKQMPAAILRMPIWRRVENTSDANRPLF